MDPQLLGTVKDLLEKAETPDLITIGVFIQDTDDEIEQYKEHFKTISNVKAIYINHIESKGCCWARSEIQKLYDDEKYYFQIDAHHRFVENWDTKCKTMIEQCCEHSFVNDNKVILSTYAVPCDLENDTFRITHQDKPYKMKCEKFYKNKKVRYVPETLDKDYDAPQRSFTISAHFLFTFGEWIKDVPYDPLFYFDSEEDSLALRSFTNGWDVFYPHEVLCYHYYIRSGSKRHTDFDPEWYKKNDVSINRFHQLLDDCDLGIYGLGNLRTLDEYYVLSGIDYKQTQLKKIESVHEICFSPLPDAEIQMITKENAELIMEYNDLYFCKKNSHWNEWSNENKNHWCHFKEVSEADEYYEIYDQGRNVYLKLHKDLSLIEVKLSDTYETMFQSEIKCIDTIEKNSKVCIFNIESPNENTKIYCNIYNYDYKCYDKEIDFDETFESMKEIYDILCYIGKDVYVVNKIPLEKLKKLGNLKYEDCFYFKCKSGQYKVPSSPLFVKSSRDIKPNTLFALTTDERLISKINNTMK